MANLKDIGKRLTDLFNNFTSSQVRSPVPQRKPIQPQQSIGQSFWQSPVGQSLVNAQKGLANTQRFIESSRPVQPIPAFQPFSSKSLTGMTGNFVANIPGSIGNTIIGKGIFDPAADISNLAGRIIGGRDIPKYNDLKSPQVRLGYNVMGIDRSPQQVIGNVAGSVDPIIAAYNPNAGYGLGKQMMNQAGKQTLMNVVKHGVKEGAVLGFIQGGVNGLADGRLAKDLQSQLFQGVQSGATGAALGGILGGLLSGGGYAFGKARNAVIEAVKRLKPHMSENQAASEADRFIRDEIGRFAKGKKIKQEPIYYGDLRESLGMSRDLNANSGSIDFNAKIGGKSKVNGKLSNSKGQQSFQVDQPQYTQSANQSHTSGSDASSPSLFSEIGVTDGNKKTPSRNTLIKGTPSQSNSYSSNIPQAGSAEQLLESSTGWAPGMRKQFDTALFSKDKEAIQKLLPQVPEEYKKRFAKEISNVIGGSGASGPSDPVQKVIQALKEAAPLRKQQEALYTAERGRRIGQAIGVGKSVPGEQGFYGQLGKLKGELPKVEYESVRPKIEQTDVDQLFNKIRDSKYITEWEKITAQGALAKILGKEGGGVPTEGEISLLHEVFGPEFTQAVLDKRGTSAKALDVAANVLNVPRSVMASFDLSAPFRQGWGLMGKPKQFLGAFKEMFRAMSSEKHYDEMLQSIKDHPNYLKMREGKLSITQQGPLLTGREEQFMSNYAEKLPGLGHIVRASDRAYTAFLNKLRSDTFNDMLEKAIAQGLPDDATTYQSIAKFINTATGRGSLGELNKASVLLSNAFFSPRLMASRFQMMNPMTYTSLPPQVRQQALKSILGSASIALTVTGMAKLAGAEVGVDPRSADFGKIKIGNTRYDLWAGFQQPIRAISQIVSGKVISTTTGKVTTLGEGYKPMTRLDIVWNFLHSKESPVASFITGILQGQNGVGQPFNVPQEVIARLMPMMASDMYNLYKEYGVMGLPMAIPGMFGVGSQTYSWAPTSKEDKMKAAALKESGMPDKEINEMLLEQKKQKIDMEQQKADLKSQVEPAIEDIPSTKPTSLEEDIWGKIKGIIPEVGADEMKPKVDKEALKSQLMKDAQESAIKDKLKYSTQNVLQEGDKLYIRTEGNSVKVVDLGTKSSSGNLIQQAKSKESRESAISSTGVSTYFASHLSDTDKNKVYKALGTTVSDVEMKALTSLKDTDQATVLHKLLTDQGWEEPKLDAYIDKDALTDNIVSKMEDQSLITEEQAKTLKAYVKARRVKTGKTKATIKKPKKASIRIANIKAPRSTNVKFKISKPPMQKSSKNTFKITKAKKPPKFKLGKTKLRFSPKYRLTG